MIDLAWARTIWMTRRAIPIAGVRNNPKSIQPRVRPTQRRPYRKPAILRDLWREQHACRRARPVTPPFA
jgi:hypothetical protein